MDVDFNTGDRFPKNVSKRLTQKQQIKDQGRMHAFLAIKYNGGRGAYLHKSAKLDAD